MWFRKLKAKWWLKKLLSKDVSNVVPANKALFIHKTDKAALSALKAIPLFDKLCSKFIALFNEKEMNIIDMSTKIRISEQQVPRIYNMVKNICAKLGIPMPNLYLELDREPNAYTYGSESVSITITSGLLECFEDDEIYAVLAHECGHIACDHVLYHTLGMFILDGGEFAVDFFAGSLIGSLVTTPIKYAFYHWMRCSELSADRAAVACCENAEPVIETMMRLAGGTTHIDSEINKSLFVEQSCDYQKIIENSKVNKLFEFYLTRNTDHPLLSIRAREAKEWSQSDSFNSIVQQFN